MKSLPSFSRLWSAALSAIVLGGLVAVLRIFEGVAATPRKALEPQGSGSAGNAAARERRRPPAYLVVATIVIVTSIGVALVSKLEVPPRGLWEAVGRILQALMLLLGLTTIRLIYRNLPPLALAVWRIGVAVAVMLAVGTLIPSGLLAREFWPTLLNLWPVLLLTVGLFVVLRHRSAPVRWGFPAIVVAGAVGGSLLYSGLTFPRITSEFLTYDFPLGDTKTARLELDLGIDGITTGLTRHSGQLLVAELVAQWTETQPITGWEVRVTTRA